MSTLQQIVASIGGSVSYLTESETLFAAMTSSPDTTRKGHINTLIGALKTAGIWAQLDLLYVMAAGNAHDAGLNWVSPSTFPLSPTNSPTFTTDRGYAGNGTNSYLDTLWNPPVNGVHATRNSNHHMGWNRTSRAGADMALYGTYTFDATDNLSCFPRLADDTLLCRNNGGYTGSGTSPGSSGMFIGNRADASGWSVYRNGSLIGPISGASIALPGYTMLLLAWNADNTPGLFSTDQIAAFSAGGSIAGAEGAYYTAMNTYMTAVGAA